VQKSRIVCNPKRAPAPQASVTVAAYVWRQLVAALGKRLR
jgi:hypothetical protein